jgi:hypothetical protein
MKATKQSTNGTCLQGYFKCTAGELIGIAKKLGANYEDTNDGRDKTNFNFKFETSDGKVFTVYDWKYYHPLVMNEEIQFNIGGFAGLDVSQVQRELTHEIRNGGVITVRVTAKITKDIDIPVEDVKQALEEDGGGDLHQKAVEIAHQNFNILSDGNDESYDQDGYVVES